MSRIELLRGTFRSENFPWKRDAICALTLEGCGSPGFGTGGDYFSLVVSDEVVWAFKAVSRAGGT